MCYWNLHKKCWSLKTGGKPVRHAWSLTLFDVEFRVWEGGRQRVLRERKKSVHAFAVGTHLGVAEPDLLEGFVRLSYNPYRGPHFVVRGTDEAIYRARWAMLLADGSLWASAEGAGKGKSDAA